MFKSTIFPRVTPRTATEREGMRGVEGRAGMREK